MRRLVLAVALLAAGCSPIKLDQAPVADYPVQCEAQVYADPKVKDLLMKSTGSDTFARQHEDELKYAKVDAAHRCAQQRGLTAPGGGVERPRVEH